jgi:hypothetical protein
MKSLNSLLALVLFCISANIAAARIIAIWPYQQLFNKADFVAIATPTATSDTKERSQLLETHVNGVETRFSVSTVLKGDKTLKEFVLHHYRPIDDPFVPPDAPSFICFIAAKSPLEIQHTYLLFLVREPDGRYVPVSGQMDPELAIKQVGTDETFNDRLAGALWECQTIKPGMTRGELSRIFTTEGGLSTPRHRTYVYRECPYIKVDVDFTLTNSTQSPAEERPTDIIAKTSRPYLEWSVND